MVEPNEKNITSSRREQVHYHNGYCLCQLLTAKSWCQQLKSSVLLSQLMITAMTMTKITTCNDNSKMISQWHISLLAYNCRNGMWHKRRSVLNNFIRCFTQTLQNMIGTFIHHASYISLVTARNLTQMIKPCQSMEAENTCWSAQRFVCQI